jgi:hypothetical protein
VNKAGECGGKQNNRIFIFTLFSCPFTALLNFFSFFKIYIRGLLRFLSLFTVRVQNFIIFFFSFSHFLERNALESLLKLVPTIV